MPNFQLFDRVVVAVDVQGFSLRNVRRQLHIQDELDRMLTQAACLANLDRAGWDRRAEGDGEMAVLPGGVDLLMIVRRFVTELDQLLTDYNEDHGPETRIRLRIAMSVGSVIPGGTLGHGGTALIELARLLDSREVRKALEAVTEANLAQIISESLFESAVVPEIGGIRPGQFRKVTVDAPAKGFRQTAYIYLPGGWPQRRPARPPAVEPILPLPAPLPAWPAPGTSTARQEPPPRAAENHEAEPAAATFGKGIEDLLADLRYALDDHEVARADRLTTRILLEAAQRGWEGSLRTSDAERLPDSLFTELDAAWAAASKGAWGFAAQRRRLAGPTGTGSGRVSFHPISLALGWRQSDDTPPPPYAAFFANGVSELPFFPTLRSPDREDGREAAWREEWRATVLAVHHRLQHWKVR